MCGRYKFEWDEKNIDGMWIKKWTEYFDIYDFSTSEVFPSDEVLAFVQDKYQIQARKFHWGIEIFDKKKIINARIESIYDKKMYSTFNTNRCCIPCSGFYEWKDKDKYFIKRQNEDIMYLAGLYKEESMVVITTEAKGNMSDIHDRMPFLLNHSQMIAYLNNQLNLETLQYVLDIEMAGESSGNID